MKAVIYARYSCDNQREESIDGQLRECKEFAVRKGMTVLGTYIDRALTAKTDHRPEFQKMIRNSSKGLFDTIVVWKLDRFARNRYDSAHYKAMLRKNGVKVVSATEVISEGAEGIILESVLEGYAEYYSAELSEKVIRGMTENALKCQYNGDFIPVGYTIDENKHYQIDELKAPFIREAFIMYVGGRQIKEIVEFLNDKGIRSLQKKPMTKTTVSTFLQNRKYMGEYKYRDVVVPDGIPAIISKELFEMAQARLRKNRYAPATMKAEDKYLLSTKLMCGTCSSFMVGESGKNSTQKKYCYYKCASAKKRKDCGKKAIRKKAIETIVLDNTVKTIFDGDIIQSIADRVMLWQDKENTAIPMLKKQLADTEKSISNIMAAIEQGIITASTKKRMNELEMLKTDIEVRLIKEEIGSRILTKEQIVFWLNNMRKLDLLNVDNRQRVIDTFVNSIYLYDDKAVINFNCREDSETIPLGLDYQCSDLIMVGEPYWNSPNTEKCPDFLVYIPDYEVFALRVKFKH